MDDSEEIKKRWDEVVRAYGGSDPDARYDDLVASFLQGGRGAIEVLRNNLRGGRRPIAVSVCSRLPETELSQVLEQLIFLASWDNGMTAEVRRLIRSVAQGRLSEIKRLIDAQLATDDDDESYLRFLELYREIDVGLMRELAMRALQDKNPLIQEAGRDAIAWLDTEHCDE